MLFHKLSVFCGKMTINSVFSYEIETTNIENLLLQTPTADFQNINFRKQTYHNSIFITISQESVLIWALKPVLSTN